MAANGGPGAAFATFAGAQAIVVTGYALLHRDRELIKQVAWRGVVLDEAQNIKNADSAQARAARSIEAGYRIAITETPVENHLGDLWSLMEFYNPDMLDTQTAFRRSNTSRFKWRAMRVPPNVCGS